MMVMVVLRMRVLCELIWLRYHAHVLLHRLLLIARRALIETRLLLLALMHIAI